MIKAGCIALAVFALGWPPAAIAQVSDAWPSYEAVKAQYQPSEAWLLDRHGRILAERRTDPKVRRLEWVALSDLSPAMKEALVVSEDRRFFEHGGVDWKAALAAAWENALRGSGAKHRRGASTLTMQLAAMLDPSLRPAAAERTVSQKWNQAMAAREIEAHWTKLQILEAYLNLVPFRGELTGIGAAAQMIFDKQPSGLDRTEALLLSALLRGPNAQPQVVARRACNLRMLLSDSSNIPACEDIRRSADRYLPGRHLGQPQENLAPHLARVLLEKPNTRIRTTLDADLQRFASATLHQQLNELTGQGASDGALIVLDNETGDVLAYVGSTGDLSDAAQVDGVQALRQAGSTLKPFLYGLAIERKLLTAASVLEDSPLNVGTGSGLYVPQNYEHDFKGPVSVRTALASSLNVPAVRALALVGVDDFAARLRRFGFGDLDDDGAHYGLGLALGDAEVRLAELANAYRALANGGMWSPLRLRPDETRGQAHRALSRGASFIVGDILSDRSARAETFGLENPLATRIWTAVKTGTSKDMRDNWCVGYSDRFTVAVWVGNFSGGPMHDVSGVTGAAPVWREIMHFLHADVPSNGPAFQGRGLVHAEVTFSPPIEPPRKEWFIAGTQAPNIELAGGSDVGAVPKIQYPADGTIIALDPDIPAAHQRVRFDARGEARPSWSLDGKALGDNENALWSPTAGRHRLDLIGDGGEVLDSVKFLVRGSPRQSEARSEAPQ